MSTPALAEPLPRPGRVPLVEVVLTEAIDARVVPRLRALLDEALALRPEHLVLETSRAARRSTRPASPRYWRHTGTRRAMAGGSASAPRPPPSTATCG